MERLADLATLYANGWIWLLLQLAARLGPLAVLALAGVWVGLVERGLMAAAAFSPPRGGVPSPRRPVSPAPMLLGGLAGLLSAAASALYPTPIPELMAAMWAGALLLVLVMPSGRWESVPGARLFLLGYALMLLAFRPFAAWTEAADPYAWAAVFGSTGEAREAMARGRSLVLTIFTWLAWFGVPGGFAVWAFNRLAALGFSLADPRATAAEIARQIRSRGASS
ncbi:MAG: hypothetical protein RMK94_12810 [Armatimonadota bacterium]|nr:hypothetical protein [Armatimonadota bacterium]